MQARGSIMTLLGSGLYIISALFVAHGQSHRRAAQRHYASAEHMFVLRCGSTVGRLLNVTWSRAEENRTMGLPPGTEVRDGDLWFLPVAASHHGTYTCERRDQRGAWEMAFMVSVSRGQCPHPAERREFKQGTRDVLPCKQMDILGLNKTTAHVNWLKDCRPLERDGGTVEVDQEGRLRLYGASKDDAGVYTCLINFTLDGQTHTSARSIQLYINDDPVLLPPALVYPINDTVLVELGSSAELRCLAHLGLGEHEENFMYWVVPHNDDDLDESWVYIHEDKGVYGLSTLSISDVIPELLNVPIRCIVMNPIDQAEGLLWLQKADHTELHTCIGVGLAFGLAVVLLVSGYFFRVDLVLAYRKLCPQLAQQIPDSKEYDAYVSYLHVDDVSSSGTATFALHVLPEVLEKQHGYSLYIRGRDDCPGEAIHDEISATVRRCRRLIIILSADVQSYKSAGTEEVLPLKHSQNHESYEQKIGLHDALMQNDPRVILVEMDGPLDYSGLSASLRYIRKQQGALQWNTASSANQRCTTLPSNGYFWKCLRYNMPPVPGGRALTTVV